MDQFDKRYRRQQNRIKTGVAVFGVAWVLYALLSLAVAVLALYAVAHFVLKFW